MSSATGPSYKADPAAIDVFIARWSGVTGGAERANYALFVSELCEALDLPKPGIAAGGTLGAYQFEGPVAGGAAGGGTGFADVYKRGCFILEAKQSKLPAQASPELFDVAPSAPTTPAGARYDQLMRDARRQAERYAHSLPGDHPPVPFLIVCDVGRAFELYFDYVGNGRGYGFFPDKGRYRIALADLASDVKLTGIDITPAELLRAIWTAPNQVDPRFRSAEVTRKVATQLAEVSRHLEQEGQLDLKRRDETDPSFRAELIEETALFLMRMLFCMFAEDVGLLPSDRFKDFLVSCRIDDPTDPSRMIDDGKLRRGLHDLWTKMGLPSLPDRWSWVTESEVRYFNGGLFANSRIFPLAATDLDRLVNAAQHQWKNVEPAIFGALLEQALSPADRTKLGAHYTPRPYVERLVQATVGDVLGPEWATEQAGIERLRADGDQASALARAERFLAHLQRQRVLDPACGTGNFLYVAMETLLRLESDVIETITTLGGEASPMIGPENCLGLEINPRAAVIAELVLWIGWLRWRAANDPTAIPDPVLRRTGTINFGDRHGYDAILARDEAGEPVRPPRTATWPDADFIVGNPPFIAGQDMRRELTGDYAEAVWAANPRVGGGADFVMQWWDRAADLLTLPEARLRRFGFVTTNSITQEFSRRVIQRHLSPPLAPRAGHADTPGSTETGSESDGEGASAGLSLVFAIPDHPWLKPPPAGSGRRQPKGERGPAAVRIAMSVAEAGRHGGRQGTVTAEHDLATDHPRVELEWSVGMINADLTVGTNVTAARPLLANAGIAHDGVKLHGKGFAVTHGLAVMLGLGDRPGLERYVRPYRNGMDLTQRNPAEVTDKYVIDFYAVSEKTVTSEYWQVADHLLSTVRPAREEQFRKSPTADARAYLEAWWLFGKPRPEMRPVLENLGRYIATVDTAKHRVFMFLPSEMLCDDGAVIIGSDDPYVLGVLQSRLHGKWSLRVGGWMGIGNHPRYNKSRTFDPFPFPDPTPAEHAAIAELAEELDRMRKAALTEHPRLSMTGLYNLVEKLRVGASLTPVEETDARDARARIVLRLHDQLDRAVAVAYGWPHDLPASEIVTRLVALNAERAAEETAGHVRWLRPDYQHPRFAARVALTATANSSPASDIEVVARRRTKRA